MAEMTCDASVCPNAAGYYTRLPKALTELEQIPLVDRQAIEDSAKAHALCPFELSLDTAVAADIVIGDYNYVFDPSVRLQRFAYGRHLSLLIDEAHQISPRVCDMLSVELTLTDIDAALLEAPASLSQAIRSVQTHVLDAGRAVTEKAGASGGQRQQAELTDTETLTESLGSCCKAAMP